MSQNFVEGNDYVFSKEKYVEHCGEPTHPIRECWVDECEGKGIDICDASIGICEGYEIPPQWCKCIKAGNNKGMEG